MYHLTVSVGLESGCSLARWFWFSISHDPTIKVSAGATVTWGLAGGGEWPLAKVHHLWAFHGAIHDTTAWLSPLQVI